MDPKLQHILDADLKNLQREIADPQLIANLLSQLLETDKDRIHVEAKSNSRIHAIHELVARLKKRGSKAFPEFVKVLHEQGLKDSATRLQNKAKQVGIEPGIEMGE